MEGLCKSGNELLCVPKKAIKNGRGTERHLPQIDESIVWPAGERRYDI